MALYLTQRPIMPRFYTYSTFAVALATTVWFGTIAAKTSTNNVVELRGHTESVWSAAFSPDGKRVVTASQDRTARIWDAATGKEFLVLEGHGNQVQSAAFSPDGKHVITGSWDNTARIWDAVTGQEIAVLHHDKWVRSVAYSPDGTRIVTGGDERTAHVWEAATGKEIAVLRNDDWVRSVAFSPEGNRIVTAAGDAKIFDATTGKQIVVMKETAHRVVSASFSPDGKRVVTTSEDQSVGIWDADTGEQLKTFWQAGSIGSGNFSPDGAFVAAVSGKQVRIWDVNTGKNIALLTESYNVYSAVYSPDGARIVTASAEPTAHIYQRLSDLPTPLDTTDVQPTSVLRHEYGVASAAFSPDGTRVVTATGGTSKLVNGRTIQFADARIWDLPSEKPIAILRGHNGPVQAAAFSPNGAYVATASMDRTARIWDAATGEQKAVLQHRYIVYSVAYSPDGTRIVTANGGGRDAGMGFIPKGPTHFFGAAVIWDTSKAQMIASLGGGDLWVTSAAFSPDGKLIVTALADGTARIWNTATMEQMAVLRGHSRQVLSAAFSLDGTRIVTGSVDNTARIWDVSTAREIKVLSGHTDYVNSAAFSPDGKRVVTASNDMTAVIWDATTGEEIGLLHGPEGPVRSAAFSPDGMRLVTASGYTVRVWNLQIGLTHSK